MTVEDLIRLRRSTKLSQAEMAREMGLGLRAYQEIESKPGADSLGDRHVLLAERCSLSLAVRQCDISIALPAVRREALDFVAIVRGDLSTGLQRGDKGTVMTKRAFDKIADGLNDAIDIANSDSHPLGEDDEDAAIFASRMSELNAGTDARLPADVSALMLRGDSLLKALRKSKKMTQVDLMKATNLTLDYISDLENGEKTGTEAALRDIAFALGVPQEWLVRS